MRSRPVNSINIVLKNNIYIAGDFKNCTYKKVKNIKSKKGKEVKRTE